MSGKSGQLVSFMCIVETDSEGDAVAKLYKVLKHDGFDSPTRELMPCYTACRGGISVSVRARNAAVQGYATENDLVSTCAPAYSWEPQPVLQDGTRTYPVECVRSRVGRKAARA